MPAATFDSEWTILLAACAAALGEQKVGGQKIGEKKIGSVQALAPNPVRWKQLLELADRHGVQPLVYQALRDVDGIPAEEARQLQQSYQTNLHKSLLLSRELIRIVAHLSAMGVEVMPYKGPALAEVLYRDIALRQSGDIDLLIHPKDLSRIRDAVRDLGYKPHLILSHAEETAYLKSGYEYSFDGAAGPNLLELQWAIQPRFYAVDFNMDDLFRRAITIAVAGQPMKTLSREDLFLVLSVHAGKHVWGRLVWLCDLARLMQLPALNWNQIQEQANELGIARIVQVTMQLAQRLLEVQIPPTVGQLEEAPLKRGRVEQDSAVPQLVEEIQTHVVTQNIKVDSPAYFRLMMRLRERPRDRRRFLWRLALTPGPSEWSAIHLPKPLFPLYRVVRLSRLAARLVRA